MNTLVVIGVGIYLIAWEPQESAPAETPAESQPMFETPEDELAPQEVVA